MMDMDPHIAETLVQVLRGRPASTHSGPAGGGRDGMAKNCFGIKCGSGPPSSH
jgi:hypothetical protein